VYCSILWIDFVADDCQKHGTLWSDCTSSDRSQALPSSEGCCRCTVSVNSAKDESCVNGEVGCSTDVACTSVKSADESCHSSTTNRTRRNCELHELQRSRVSVRSSCETTEQLDTCSLTRQDCTHCSDVDEPRSCTSAVHFRSHSEQLTNGTDKSCSDAAEDSGSCTAEVSAVARLEDAVSETTELCKSAVDAVCVSESTRQNILSAAETFASIIGREIAASFDLKDEEKSSPECRGGDSASVSHRSTACAAASTNSLTTHATGSKLVAARRKCEPDGGLPLDTAEVARRVRDILTVNNVGQRQFARYVLGLSQGTVSELLAKPKPWDRLTEKGKESYRRMNQWAGDQLGVLSLKDHVNSVALKANLLSPKGKNLRYLLTFQFIDYVTNTGIWWISDKLGR